MEEPAKTKKVTIRTAALAAAVLLAVFLSASAVAIYAFSGSGLSERLRKVFPYPVALVGDGGFISFRELDENLASVRRFYENQSESFAKAGLRIDFSTPEGRKRLSIREKELLDKMIEDAAIEVLAEERGIRISDEAVRQNLDRKLKESGNESDVKERLARLYGWSLDDFEEKVVRPETYKEELEKAFLRETDTSLRAKRKIEEAKKALDGGLSFEEAAARYSEGATGREGGDLGWISVEDLSPEVAGAVKDQPLNRATDIVESDLGFHILVVREKKKEDGGELVSLRQIFARKTVFADWLTEQMGRIPVRILSSEYRWNVEKSRVDFERPDMRAFEEEHFRNSQGDASVLF
jgi:parvulin-like peptidyl-prolyl isomerase